MVQQHPAVSPLPARHPGVITRFAPSPTGHLHVGGARTALFCWAFAKKMGGHFTLRIEDTDAARSSDESARGIMEDLAWLGIVWDEGPELVLRLSEAGGDSSAASTTASEMRGARSTIGGDPRGVGPFFQARRIAMYNQYVEQLVRAGRAYPAFESTEEIEALRKVAVAAKQTFRYPRPADVQAGVFNQARWTRAQGGESHVVRFLAPHEQIIVPDQVLGDVKIAPGELDDFVIRKADGLPTYHFAVVIDDQLMGITHVLRAQEHLANTPRHVALQRALRDEHGQPFRTPIYGHMPLIFNMDATKMSKRDKAKAARKALKDVLSRPGVSPGTTPAILASQWGIDPALLADFLAAENDNLEVAEKVGHHLGVALPEIEVSDFREAGYVPEAINNFLALLGWNPGMKLPDGKDLEKFDVAFLAQHFSIERIGKTNSKVDRAKLLSFNADALGAMSDEEFGRRWMAWMAQYDAPAHQALRAHVPASAMPHVIKAAKPRAKTFRDASKALGFVMLDDQTIAFDKAAADKHLLAGEKQGLSLLREFRARLGTLDTWEPGPIHAIIEAIVKDKALPNPGPLAQAARIALAGVPVTPQLDLTLAILGKQRSVARIERCLGVYGG